MKLDFEFRNGWCKDDRKWYGFHLAIPINIAFHFGCCGATFWLSALGFEIYVYFLKEDSDE